jgi:hypothetical protein
VQATEVLWRGFAARSWACAITNQIRYYRSLGFPTLRVRFFLGSPENAARRVAASAAVGVSPSRRKWRPSRTHNACRLMPWRAALSVKPRSPVGRGPGYVSARYSPRLDTPSARYSAFLSQTIASPSIRNKVRVVVLFIGKTRCGLKQ